MPEFTEKEKKFVRGTSDFFGVNHYSTLLISSTEYKVDYPVPSLYDDAENGYYFLPEWPRAASFWLVVSC